MADKYAHKVARPRWCYLDDGRPKHRFRTEAEADRVARSEPRFAGTHAYQCPTCTAWHVGHDDPQDDPT